MRRPGVLHSGPTSRVNVRLDPEDSSAMALLLGPGAHRLDNPPPGFVVAVSAHPSGTVTVGGRSLPAPCVAWEATA